MDSYTVYGYPAKLPKSLSGIARLIAGYSWPEVQSQHKLRCPDIGGYVGEFSCAGHGGMVVVAKSPINHPEAEKHKITGPVWPSSMTVNQTRCKIINLPTDLHGYIFEEDCDWAALVAAVPSVADAMAARGAYGGDANRVREEAAASLEWQRRYEEERANRGA